jgi:2-C-methyl-D-erythritol 4-phosphate cytidylyltransferase/2-C-methyl-D-erythritol 2,4-cyclodiphosphate synthase
LKLDESRISIKATTSEKLGFTGREEGIVAMAVATIYSNNNS